MWQIREGGDQHFLRVNGLLPPPTCRQRAARPRREQLSHHQTSRYDLGCTTAHSRKSSPSANFQSMSAITTVRLKAE